MTVWAYGDSFVAGDQDIPGRVDAIEENTEYNRYNISFVSHLAKSLNRPLINRGISGCSNFVQLDRLWLDSFKFEKGDLILFGITTPWRDRFTIPYECPGLLKKNRAPGIVNRDLVNDNVDFKKIAIIDLFYTLSVIEKIEKTLGVKIIKFNLFHNALTDADRKENRIFKFDNFIGSNIVGNTLLDVLTNNWGNETVRISDHSQWKPPAEYKHLFTEKSHPSSEGHKLIAKWLEDRLKELDVI